MFIVYNILWLTLCKIPVLLKFINKKEVIFIDSNKLIKLGNIYPSCGQSGEIYDEEGICPTRVTFTGGGGKQPIVLIRNKEGD